MKIVKKLIPLITIPAILSPLTLTSCSKKYTDILSYQPDGFLFEEKQLSEKEATDLYFSHENTNNIQTNDLYACAWEFSKLVPEYFGSDGKFLVYLLYVSDYSCHKNDKGKYVVSYKLKEQIQYRQTTDPETKSYAVDEYVVDWQVNNIPHVLYYVKNSGYKSDWLVKPEKYHYETATWDDLEGDENITFNIRTIEKGYSQSGAQNYIYESDESATIDADHKYVPALSELLSALFFFYAYSMQNISKK